MKVQLAILIVFSFTGLTAVAAQKSETLNGEIMDSACAKSGSHEGMMKQSGMKTAKDCTLACVGHGSKYVLFDPSTKAVYELDDQKKPESFAGQKVTVTGTVDDATKMVHVATIKA